MNQNRCLELYTQIHLRDKLSIHQFIKEKDVLSFKKWVYFLNLYLISISFQSFGEDGELL